MSADSEVSLTLASRRQIRELNRVYRHVDEVTDVLSFSQLGLDTVTPPSGPVLLGDLVLCVDVAREQARRYGHDMIAELAALLAHGTAHLLGFTHTEAASARRMAEFEMGLLDRVGIEPDVALAGRV